MSNSVLVPNAWTETETPLRETALYLYDRADEMKTEHVEALVEKLTPAFDKLLKYDI